MLFYLAFFIVGGILIAYWRNSGRSEATVLLHRRLARQNPDIEYEYNRFNTNPPRDASSEVTDGVLHFESDIHLIEIANQTLVARVRSELGEVPVLFDLVVMPFGKALFDAEGYQKFDQDGTLLLYSYGEPTKEVLNYLPDLASLVTKIPDEPGASFLLTHTFTIDPADSAIIIEGALGENGDYKVSLDHKRFRLKVEAELSALLTDGIFRPESEGPWMNDDRADAKPPTTPPPKTPETSPVHSPDSPAR